MAQGHAEYRGPNKVEAKQLFTSELKPILQAAAKAPDSLVKGVNKVIDESIHEGIEKCWIGEYSAKGWAIFGKPECLKEIKKKFTEKLRQFKVTTKKKNFKKAAFGKNPTRHHRTVGEYLGGRKTRRRKSRKMKGGHHLYKRLGVSKYASQKHIRKAYNKLKKKKRVTSKIRHAYNILSKKKSRRKYNLRYKTRKH